MKIKKPLILISNDDGYCSNGICTLASFLTDFALTGGEPLHKTEMLALNIYSTFYGRVGAEGVGQAKAVVFFIIVVAIGLLQLKLTRDKEVQQ